MIEIIESEFIELLAGRRPEIEVGSLPFEVKKYFQCSRDTIFLTTVTARKIIEKHGGHIDFSQIALIPQALMMGLWIGDKPHSCAISYVANNTGQRYIAATKITIDRTRCYLTTFHFAAARQTKSKLKNGQPLRLHW